MKTTFDLQPRSHHANAAAPPTMGLRSILIQDNRASLGKHSVSDHFNMLFQMLAPKMGPATPAIIALHRTIHADIYKVPCNTHLVSGILNPGKKDSCELSPHNPNAGLCSDVEIWLDGQTLSMVFGDFAFINHWIFTPKDGIAPAIMHEEIYISKIISRATSLHSSGLHPTSLHSSDHISTSLPQHDIIATQSRMCDSRDLAVIANMLNDTHLMAWNVRLHINHHTPMDDHVMIYYYDPAGRINSISVSRSMWNCKAAAVGSTQILSITDARYNYFIISDVLVSGPVAREVNHYLNTMPNGLLEKYRAIYEMSEGCAAICKQLGVYPINLVPFHANPPLFDEMRSSTMDFDFIKDHDFTQMCEDIASS